MHKTHYIIGFIAAPIALLVFLSVGIGIASAEECGKKISTQDACDITATSVTNATSFTLRVYDGYDTKRLERTIDFIDNPVVSDWNDNGSKVGTQYDSLTSLWVVPVDGHIGYDDNTGYETEDAKTDIDWGREASEFFVDFYDTNSTKIETKTYYIIDNHDSNLEEDGDPKVVRDPVKVNDSEEDTSQDDSMNTRNDSDTQRKSSVEDTSQDTSVNTRVVSYSRSRKSATSSSHDDSPMLGADYFIEQSTLDDPMLV